MKKRILNILMVICIVIALGSGGYLAYYYYTSNHAEGNISSLREQMNRDEELAEDGDSKPDMLDVDGLLIQAKFGTLYKENKDFIGWLKIEDTHIDYPVMYSTSEGGEYYIHRDFEGEYSASGLLFMDANCSFSPTTDNVIIYGHNMNSGTMFHDLLKYEDEEFYQKHKTFSFDTIYEDGEYEVVAVIRGQILPEESTEFKYYEFVNAGSKDEFLSYVENIKSMSLISTDVPVEYGDHLLTLSTCAYHVKDGRFAIIAKKME